MKYLEFKNLARKTFPCKIFQGKISLQDLSRKTVPCKIFQGKHFLARSCKKKISWQDLVRHVFFARILHDPCKVCIHSQPGGDRKEPIADYVIIVIPTKYAGTTLILQGPHFVRRNRLGPHLVRSTLK